MRRGSRLSALCRVIPVALILAMAACGEQTSPFEPEAQPDTKVMKHIAPPCSICEDPDGYDTSHNYGNYSHYSGYTSSDAQVNYWQNDSYNQDTTAFGEFSRDWTNPDNAALYNWPAAAARGVVKAGRSLARTTRIREAVKAGARWARDVTVNVAAEMLAGGLMYNQYASTDDIPLNEFDFMFDYAGQQ